MARVRAKTAARGYSGRHPAERQRRLAAYQPGDICANGGERLNFPLPVRVSDRWGTRLVSPYLDLPHTTDRTGYLPGLSCRKHNRSEGATRRNRLRGQQRAAAKATRNISAASAAQPLRTSRQW